MKNIVYLYIFDTMADWEIGFLSAELNSKRYFKNQKSLIFVTVANTKDPIVTMGALKVIPDIEIKQLDIDNAVALILPGGNTWLDTANDPVLSIAEACLDNGVLVAAICGATLGLAKVGLLNSRYHTSNDLDFLKYACPNYLGQEYYKHDPAVIAENLITASGTAPLDFSKCVLEKLDVFLPQTLESWYKLYKTHESKYFFELINLIKE